MMCCICFEGIDHLTCWTEPDGERWDLCSEECAHKAGWDGESWPEGR